MTTEEFSLEFDILFNNISSNKAPGLNSYEKSKFLTRAQEEIVRELYSGGSSTGFEGSEEITSYLNTLVKKEVASIPSVDGDRDNVYSEIYGANAYNITIKSDAWFITWEIANIEYSCGSKNSKYAQVVPVTQNEFFKIYKNPFRGISNNRVLRMTTNGRTSELISKYPVTRYVYKYLEKPEPIILENLKQAYGDDVTIDGKQTAQTCKLHQALHRIILDRAVALAKAVWA